MKVRRCNRLAITAEVSVRFQRVLSWRLQRRTLPRSRTVTCAGAIASGYGDFSAGEAARGAFPFRPAGPLLQERYRPAQRLIRGLIGETAVVTRFKAAVSLGPQARAQLRAGYVLQREAFTPSVPQGVAGPKSRPGDRFLAAEIGPQSPSNYRIVCPALSS
jgi:hypothetical protein